MFNVNSTFYEFLTALENKLDLEFDLKALSETACLLYTDLENIQLVYYLVGSGKRIPVDSNGRCIHIDEDLWINRRDLLLNRIAALAGKATRVHARSTVVSRIEKSVAMAFLQEHHLQVPLPGKFRYGLYHDGDLVAVAVFSGGRRMTDKPADYRSFELLRFCHKQGVHVVGGFGKLVDAFEQDFEPGDVMTYADKDWSDGSSYRKTGFAIVGETSPQVFWLHRDSMTRYYERTLPPPIAAMPESERIKAGFVAVSNSGSVKLVKG